MILCDSRHTDLDWDKSLQNLKTQKAHGWGQMWPQGTWPTSRTLHGIQDNPRKEATHLSPLIPRRATGHWPGRPRLTALTSRPQRQGQEGYQSWREFPGREGLVQVCWLSHGPALWWHKGGRQPGNLRGLGVCSGLPLLHVNAENKCASSNNLKFL